ncbi:MAG: SsrA-binding protein SmpB [Coriobacteriia bacterium]|jgi:SsrA-binding protein|nr:SsrA-binding protein SmpB [Coriobacteriia bacterium]MDR2714161.1 SsrA-binding protein SmpB [Coriobacteriales bacterium]
MAKDTSQNKQLAVNRKARHEYSLEEIFEAGLVLTGTEVRSLREGGGQLTDTFALVRKGEAWLHGLHIRPYSHGNRFNQEPDRVRKLLLHKKQIRYLDQKASQAGFTIVPLSLYFSPEGKVKVEIALAKGKKTYDKRDSIAKRDSDREVARALKQRSQE